MRHPLHLLLRAATAVGFIALFVGCSGSTSTQSSSTTTNQVEIRLIASEHAATDLLDACLRGDTNHLLPHVETHLRAAQWANACKALRDHHMKLVSASAVVHGDKATVRVRLQTHDAHPRGFDEVWHLSYHGTDGWQLATMPAVIAGSWDNHDWNTTPPTHHDDHQTGTSTTVHHDDHQTGTSTTVHHDDHQIGTSTTIHHDDHQTITNTTIHHDDHQTITSTTIHHTETDH